MSATDRSVLTAASLTNITGVLKRVLQIFAVTSVLYLILANNWGWQVNARDQINKSAAATTKNNQHTVAHDMSQPTETDRNARLKMPHHQQSSNRPRKKTRKKGKIKLANHNVPASCLETQGDGPAQGCLIKELLKGHSHPTPPSRRYCSHSNTGAL